MQRKVFAVGNSKGVSIPADYLSKLDLGVGAEVAEWLQKHVVQDRK